MATINKIMVGVDNEIIELTGEDKARYLAQKILDDQLTANEKAEAQAKATAKTALLDRLGITADEAKLLLS